jgi:hypothetical protein
VVTLIYDDKPGFFMNRPLNNGFCPQYKTVLTLIAAMLLGSLPARTQNSSPSAGAAVQFPCDTNAIAHYIAHKVSEPIRIDGLPDEKSWQAAPQSPRFVDIITGKPAMYDTRAAVLWDDENLYVAYWVEEPNVAATLTEYGSLIYQNNDIELFIAGRDAYYEFELNALNTVYEVFFVWEDDYQSGGFAEAPEFLRNVPKVRPFNGVAFKNHPRGKRIGFWNWRFPGLKSAVHVDGTLNDGADRDRGWTVEIALPWAGMKWLALADGRALPPRDGDVWRIDFSRFNLYKAPPPATDSGGWFWSPHGIWDSHIPECFPYIHFSTRKTVTHDGVRQEGQREPVPEVD